jgi:hypothetical protein
MAGLPGKSRAVPSRFAFGGLFSKDSEGPQDGPVALGAAARMRPRE